ncbi:MAG TPA: DUF2723 domain-containing protein [Candidatus Baltobacteraceae bacterium]|nr:DUF2723 domain-containing protein [Candidatus Baltobacteraceae bacterium]
MPLLVYAASLEGAISFWDTGEAQTVPWIFGIMHPTGFPAFTILAGIFAHVMPFGAVSWRIALFSALAMSGAAWLVFRIARELAGGALAALGAAWLFAFGQVVWTRGTRAEIHDVAVFFILASLYCALLWRRTGNSTALYLCAFAFGTGIATHSITVLLTPALLLVIFSARRLNRRQLLAASALFVLALCTYAYLPARSFIVDRAHLDPTAAIGKPPGNVFWDTDDPSTLGGFVRLVTGSEFPTRAALRGIINWHVYADNGPGFLHDVLESFTPVGLLLALGGLLAIFRRDRILAGALALALYLPAAFAFGYTVVADIDRYYFTAFATVAILAGLGAAALADIPVKARFWRAGAAIVPLALAVFLVWTNKATFAQASDNGAREAIDSVVARTPDRAILIAPWQQATALAYGAYVEKRLGARIVDSSWYGDDAAYIPAWVRMRPVYVVGELWGNVPGYHTKALGGWPPLYRVVKN